MHTYMKTEEGPWTVGYQYAHKDGWNPIADFDNEWEAAATTSYLNGGLNPSIVKLILERHVS